jgi:hypothetical protein
MNAPKDHPAAAAPTLPAIEANLFNAEAAGHKVRVTFGQQWLAGGDIAWFSAVAMNLNDAAQLRDALDDVIRRAEEHLAKKP